MKNNGAMSSIRASLLTLFKLFSISLAFTQPARRSVLDRSSQYLSSFRSIRLTADEDEVNKEGRACAAFVQKITALTLLRKYALTALIPFIGNYIWRKFGILIPNCLSDHIIFVITSYDINIIGINPTQLEEVRCRY
jgi:hypothetical protein